MTRSFQRLLLVAGALALLGSGADVHAATRKAKHKPAPPPKHQVLDPLTPTPPPPPLPITDADWRTPDPDNLIVIDTNKGRIIAELAPEAAPETVARIKTLARQHFYDGQTFFRVIDSFMDQTGDPKNTGEGGSKLPDVKGEFTFRRDHATPFVQVSEPSGSVIGLMGSLPVESQPDAIMAITADGKATAWPVFCPGALGFARAAGPDSGNSQFFLMRAAYPSLEKRYTGFGRVIVGQDVVRAIKSGEPVAPPQDAIVRLRMADDLPAGEALHVRVLDATKPAFATLLARDRDEKGADFSVCDLQLPSDVK